MRTTVLLLVTLCMLSSCTTTGVKSTMDSAQFISSSVGLVTTYNAVHEIVELKFDKFTPTDQAILTQVDQNLDNMIKIVRSWGSLDTQTVSVNWASVTGIYENSRDNYLLAKEIINNNEHLFTYIDRMHLENFDNNAAFLNNRYELMSSRPELVNTGAFVADAIDISVTLAKILIPIIKGM